MLALTTLCTCAQEKGLSSFTAVCFARTVSLFKVSCAHIATLIARTTCCARTVSLFKKKHCLCANKWAVPFHYLVFCTNSFPVLIGIYSLYATMSLSDALMHRALSFQLGDVSTESSIPYDKFGQPSMGVKPTCHFVDNSSIGYWIETLI